MGVVVGHVHSPFVGGGSSHPWVFIIRPWGLSSSVGGVVAAVPGRCLLWVLGRCWWAPGHLVVGGRAVVRGWRLSLWVLGVCGQQLSLWVLGVHGCWVVIRRSWAVVCGRWGLWVVYVIHEWWVVVHGQVVHGRVVHGLGCGLWAWWCHVMCRVSWLAKSDGMSGGTVLTVVHNLDNDK